MQIQVKDGYLTGYATVGGFPDGIEVDAALIEAIRQADAVCGRCGCELDPLYRRAIALLS